LIVSQEKYFETTFLKQPKLMFLLIYPAGILTQQKEAVFTALK